MILPSLLPNVIRINLLMSIGNEGKWYRARIYLIQLIWELLESCITIKFRFRQKIFENLQIYCWIILHKYWHSSVDSTLIFLLDGFRFTNWVAMSRYLYRAMNFSRIDSVLMIHFSRNISIFIHEEDFFISSRWLDLLFCHLF